jgi:putative SOS response-associated peptidase YedK
MPVILRAGSYDEWLDVRVKDKGKLQELLKPYSAKAAENFYRR